MISDIMDIINIFSCVRTRNCGVREHGIRTRPDAQVDRGLRSCDGGWCLCLVGRWFGYGCIGVQTGRGQGPGARGQAPEAYLAGTLRGWRPVAGTAQRGAHHIYFWLIHKINIIHTISLPYLNWLPTHIIQFHYLVPTLQFCSPISNTQ